MTSSPVLTAQVWDLSCLEVVKRLEGPRRPVLALEVGVVSLPAAALPAREVAVLVAASSDNKVRVYKQDTWQLLATIEGHAGDIFCMAFVGNLLCFGSQDTNVKVRYSPQAALVATLTKLRQTMDLSVVLARAEAKGAAEASGEEEKKERLQLKELPFCSAREHNGFVYALDVHGTTLFSASGDSTVILRDISRNAGGEPSLAVLSTLSGHEGSVYDVMSDGSYIYTAGQDGKIRVWDQETGYLRRTLSGHEGEVLALAQAGSYFFSGDSSGLLKVWDKKTLRCLFTEDLGTSIMVIRHNNGIVFVASGSVVRVGPLPSPDSCFHC